MSLPAPLRAWWSPNGNLRSVALARQSWITDPRRAGSCATSEFEKTLRDWWHARYFQTTLTVNSTNQSSSVSRPWTRSADPQCRPSRRHTLTFAASIRHRTSVSRGRLGHAWRGRAQIMLPVADPEIVISSTMSGLKPRAPQQSSSTEMSNRSLCGSAPGARAAADGPVILPELLQSTRAIPSGHPRI